jgi:chemotaxis protein MotA
VLNWKQTQRFKLLLITKGQVKIMVDFIIKLNPHFTDVDKEACLPVIDKIVEFATIARSNGLLALELSANQAENIFLRTALNLIVDANDPDKVREMLEHFILADNHSGAELLSRLIILEGVMRIAAGSNPRLIEEGLNMMLGEKYVRRAAKLRAEEDEKAKIRTLEQLYEKVKNQQTNIEYAGVEWILMATDDSTLQATLENVSDTDIYYAVQNFNFKTIQRIMENLDKDRHSKVFDDVNCYAHGLHYRPNIKKSINTLFSQLTGEELERYADYEDLYKFFDEDGEEEK